MNAVDRAWARKHPKLAKATGYLLVALALIPFLMVLRLILTAAWAFSGN